MEKRSPAFPFYKGPGGWIILTMALALCVFWITGNGLTIAQAPDADQESAQIAQGGAQTEAEEAEPEAEPQEAQPSGEEKQQGSEDTQEAAPSAEAKPEEQKPEESQPEQAEPEATQSQGAAPVEAQQEEVQQEEAQQEEAQQEEAQQEEAQQEEAQQEEAEAQETQPAEAEPESEETTATEEAEPQEAATEEAQAEPEPAEEEAEETEAEPEPAEEEAEETEDEESFELSNESCMDCHTQDILEMTKEDYLDMVETGDEPAEEKVKPLYSVGELSLAIDLEKYQDSVHSDMGCIDCHMDIEEIPHAQRLQKVDCSECHDAEAVNASAHGEDTEVGCVGCHDVHYSQGAGEYEEGWKQKYCMECHDKYGMDTKDAHKDLYEFELHQKTLGCMACHQGEEPGAHNIAQVSDKVADCEACHSKYSILTAEKYEPADSLAAYYSQTSFINADSLKEYGYVVGSHRIPLLDLIIILLVIGPIGLPIVHGGLRIITRRKEPLELPEEKILLHPLLERLWHWAQAICIVMLIITGAIIHWPEYFTGWFDWAVSVHNWFGIATVVLFIIWLLYNLFSGRISHYFPNRGDVPKRVIVQAKFYGYGIFKHEPHPYPPREDDKFNPLQKLAYLSFQVLLMPILLITGILYMYPMTFAGTIEAIGGMTVLGVVHYILGGLFASFLVAHLYLATTGETIGENFKAIITGYGIKEEHGHGDDEDEVKKA